MTKPTFDGDALQRITCDPLATNQERALAMALLQAQVQRAERRVTIRYAITLARRLATETDRPVEEVTRLKKRLAIMCDEVLEFLAR